MNVSKSRRESALEALSVILKDIEGVVRVKRQAITKEMLSSHEVPGIVIDEVTDRMEWLERFNGRDMGVSAVVVLDCQVQGTEGNVSTKREAMKWLVLNQLSNNPSLKVQLEGEDEAVPHAMDCANKFDIRYVEEKFPYGRVLITIIIQLEEVFDDRETTEWSTLLLNSGTDEDSPVSSRFDKDEDEPATPDDYFQWRQDEFDPYFHLPLNDPEGSDVAVALAGPDGVHTGAQKPEPGAKSVIRPYEYYASTRYGSNDTTVGDAETFSFVNKTWTFTILFWARFRDTREWPLATSAATNISPGFTWEIFPNRLNFRMKTDAAQEIISDSDRIFEPEQVYHFCVTGDGTTSRLYIDGVQVSVNGVPPLYDGPSAHHLYIAGVNRVDGDIGGVIIDDKCWSAADVQADYLHGMDIQL